MLKSHIDAIESSLLAISKIPANAGHPLHKGTPRESFIRNFLEGHLGETVAIGSGEIIDADSSPNQPRNQVDIVIYKRNYPKLDFGGGINCFLAESVVATIEVKSTLDEAAMIQSVGTAKNVKALKRNFINSFVTGYQPPGILSYVVAYDGPASVKTVHGWFSKIHAQLGINYPAMPPNLNGRLGIASTSVDGVFILGRGFICFDNSPITLIQDEMRQAHPDLRWGMADVAAGSLLQLFLVLTQATSGVSGSWLNPYPYIANVIVPNSCAAP